MLDIHQEKFALAIIKAIELPSNFNTDSQVKKPSLLVKLSNFGERIPSEDMEAWHHIYNLMEGNNQIKVKKVSVEDRANAIKILNILEDIKKFAKANFTGINTSVIDNAFTDLVAFSTPSPGSPVFNASNVNMLFTNYDFKKWLLSYYLDKSIDEVSIELSTKIGNPTLTPLITNILNNWILAVFDHTVIGKKNQVERMKEALGDIRNIVTAYLDEEMLPISIDPRIKKLVYLINDISKSDDAEQISIAFEKFSLPAGSYAIKREAKFNVALNAFPGLWGGTEHSFRWAERPNVAAAGFALPVGLSVSWSRKWPIIPNGIFIPIIDIGAVTRFRFDSTNTTKALPEFNFKNLFSPGIYVQWHHKNSPFSINAFLQYGPELKKIDPINPSIATFYETMHGGLSLTLDIPILNFYTKPRGF